LYLYYEGFAGVGMLPFSFSVFEVRGRLVGKGWREKGGEREAGFIINGL